MNTLNYLKAICYQYKAKFRDLENLFPRINNGEVEITPEIDEIVATTNISENTGIERPCRVCLERSRYSYHTVPPFANLLPMYRDNRYYGRVNYCISHPIIRFGQSIIRLSQSIIRFGQSIIRFGH